MRRLEHVEIDARRIVHHVGIVFAGEDVAGAAHIGRQLIDFVEPAVDHVAHEIWIAKIADHEIISLGLAEAWKFQIDASDPEALPFEPPHQVVTDEATCPADQGRLANATGLHCKAPLNAPHKGLRLSVASTSHRCWCSEGRQQFAGTI